MAQFSDLLQSQIKSHCKLSLPEGLKELMSDISREVLRAQPKDLYDFITKYLAALLVSRENLSIASRVCQDVCHSTCHPELDILLRDIGLDEDDATKAKEIIDKYFEEGGADKQTLMLRIMAKTNISKAQLAPLQYAIREAFLQHQLNNVQDDTDRKTPSVDNEISRAAIHTLELYAKTGPSEEEYNQKANRIQTAYRAYGVRRFCPSKPGEDKRQRSIHFIAQAPDTDQESTNSSESSCDYDINSVNDEKEVSSFQFIEPAVFSAKESKTCKDDSLRNNNVVPKVSFIDPLIFEISQHTIDTDHTVLEEEFNYTTDDSIRNEIKLTRNSHNILDDVEKRRGNTGFNDDDQFVNDDETDQDRSYSISSNIVSSTINVDVENETAEQN